MLFRTLVSVIIVITISLCNTQVASAHNTIPRVEINIDRQIPGGVIDVRGVSFGMDDIVTLTLIGSNIEIPLGEVLANAEGEFLYIAALPTDLVPGTYYFRATTSHHWVLSPPLTVWGTAIEEGGGQGLRDEDDGLLAPMPTFAPAEVTLSVPAASSSADAPQTSNRNNNMLILVALMAVLALGALSLRTKKAV